METDIQSELGVSVCVRERERERERKFGRADVLEGTEAWKFARLFMETGKTNSILVFIISTMIGFMTRLSL